MSNNKNTNQQGVNNVIPSVDVPSKGMHKDTPKINQPDGTYTFALNGLLESEEGDLGFMSNEPSNELFTSLKDGYLCIGSVYIDDGETLIFSVKKGDEYNISEIGILNVDKRTYTEWCNDEISNIEDKLNFQINKPIQATYRLRRGCEKTVYWTDDYNLVRRVNLSEKKFYYKNGQLIAKKFAIRRNINNIPYINKYKINDTGGQLKVGSFIIGVRYVDLNKNYTEVVYETKPIIVYQDSINLKYSEIDGDINLKDNKYYNVERTTKSVSFAINNLDESFEYYALVFINFTDAFKEPSEVYQTNPIPIRQKEYTYTGVSDNKISLEQVVFANSDQQFSSARTITQFSNRLLLGNTKGLPYNWGDLQKYASQINVDCLVKKVSLNRVSDRHNCKNPLHNQYGTEFMPGEVYSLGIVWKFEGNIKSPVYHITGNSIKNKVYGQLTQEEIDKGYKLLPMSIDNESQNMVYSQRETCNNFDYWGYNSNNQKLLNNKVRFHRLPNRSEEFPLHFLDNNNTSNNNSNVGKNSIIEITMYSTSKNDEWCNAKNEGLPFCYKTTKEENGQPKEIKLCTSYNYTFLFSNGDKIEENNIDDNLGFFKVSKESYIDNETNRLFGIKNRNNNVDETKTIYLKKITKTYVLGSYREKDGVFKVTHNPYGLTESNGKLNPPAGCTERSKGDIKEIIYELSYDMESNTDEINDNILFKNSTSDNLKDSHFIFLIKTYLTEVGSDDFPLVSSYIYGLKFSNIPMPQLRGLKCIGYEFVRQRRKEKDKTILDTAYGLPLIKSRQFHTLSVINSEFPNNLGQKNEGYSNKGIAILSPRYKFQNFTFDDFSTIEQVQSYKIESVRETGFYVQDVLDYKTENPKHTSAYTSSGGTDLKTVIRFNSITKTNIVNTELDNIKRKDVDIYDLQACEYAAIDKDVLMNLDMLNSSLLLWNTRGKFKTSCFSPNGSLYGERETSKKFPYLIIKKEHKNYYEDYQTDDYISIGETDTSFNGGTYVSALRYTNMLHGNIQPKIPTINRSAWDYIKAGLAIVVGVLISVFSAGTLSIVGGILIAAGGAFFGIKAEVNYQHLTRALNQFWLEGLNKVYYDRLFYSNFVNYEINSVNEIGGTSDAIRHYGQIIGDFIFESEVNMGLRVQNSEDKDNYLRPFSPYMTDMILRIAPVQENTKWKNSHPGQVIRKYTISTMYQITHNGGDDWRWAGDGVGVPIDQKEQSYFLNKVCNPDDKRKKSDKNSNPDLVSGYLYGKIKTNEYVVNQDYSSEFSIMKYYPIPFEYSFCSECRESFPQRFSWSNQSFSEELNDNYNIFKANNYKDLSGEYGEIMNMFDFNGELYIHTKNGLWKQPANYQERVSNDIVSYIGTGEFGSLPAQLIVNDKTGSSAGLEQRDAFVLTPFGYYFVCEKEMKVYCFNGKLEDISSKGLSKWFKNNLVLVSIDTIGVNNNCPYLENGCGYYLNYDVKNERILLTKRDNRCSDFNSSCKDDYTISYNLKSQSWVSFHSYIPDRYIQVQSNFITTKGNKFYLHAAKYGKYQEFYGKLYPFIIEYISNEQPFVTKIYDYIRFLTEAYQYSQNNEEYVNKRYITFNKAILYNERQCSNVLKLKVKDLESEQDYMVDQVKNSDENIVTIDRTEKDWLLNDFRDLVTNYDVPFFNSDIRDINENNNNEFIDKIINNEAFITPKEWYDLESFRSKYLVIRLIFDTFANTKLVFNFNSINNTISQY